MYVLVDVFDNHFHLSMINLGSGLNMFELFELSDYLLKEYEYGVCIWKTGIRNEKFIKRLLKKYNIKFTYGYKDMTVCEFYEEERFNKWVAYGKI